jgi:hypothetical protein
MFTLKFSEIRDPDFMAAIRKLAGYGKYKDPKTAYSISRIVKIIDQQSKAMREAFLKLVKQYAVLTETGDIKLNSDMAFEIPDDKTAEWQDVVEGFHEQKVEIHWKQLNVTELEGVELSPMELLALESVITAPLEAVA